MSDVGSAVLDALLVRGLGTSISFSRFWRCLSRVFSRSICVSLNESGSSRIRSGWGNVLVPSSLSALGRGIDDLLGDRDEILLL